MTGLERRAVRAAMYKAQRTELRPPRMVRRPRNWPLSRLKGAMPTRAAICWRFNWPSSGTSASRQALDLGAHPRHALNDLGLLFPLIVRLDQRGNLLLEASDSAW